MRLLSCFIQNSALSTAVEDIHPFSYYGGSYGKTPGMSFRIPMKNRPDNNKKKHTENEQEYESKENKKAGRKHMLYLPFLLLIFYHRREKGSITFVLRLTSHLPYVSM